ncbi:hypothetical protein Syun_021966 [Stephania yunnanensis]|uniref:FAD-binding PCMH-type domain-containing protein n=1 Tax=Stephania yunnanensis TaxID=152371 RepID=A0AAP0IGK6_9MAGN
METPKSSTLFSQFYVLLVVFSISCSASSSPVQDNFVLCLNNQSSKIPFYAPNTPFYSTILQSSIKNLRFLSSTTPKPQLIVTPLDDSHVQASVICCRKHGLQLKVRSGGHDYEGLSYTSDVPFIVVDLVNIGSVDVNVEEGSAWVQAGATLGEVYYKIAEKSRTYGFPGGTCHTVGVGGHFSGGGYGTLARKFGLAADNIIDARLVNANGEILDRKSMGEDLFWAIRGGGGGSFGVVVAWKIKLVPVPQTVTVSMVSRFLEQGANALVLKWQRIAHTLPKELFIRVQLCRVDTRMRVTFQTMYLGTTDQLLKEVNQSFPELGLRSSDCAEMSWIQSILSFDDFPKDGALDVLLNRTQTLTRFFKAKSDFVKEPFSETVLRGIWKQFYDADEAMQPMMFLSPYGGRLSEIGESEIPFPHRKEYINEVQHLAWWDKEGIEASNKNIDWLRRLYGYMTPYVSQSPRASYINYRDLDLGHSSNGTATYAQASAWGVKYFNNNFEKLVQVKSKFDPDNFFRNEQSIPVV